MIALRLVHLIEDHSDTLIQGLLQKLKLSPRTQDFSKVPQQELQDRMQELLTHMGEWLLHKKDSDIQSRYRAIGARRASQHVSLSDFYWAIVMTKEHIWEFLQRQGFLQSPVEIYGELELLRLLDGFFDRALYHVTEGYEQFKDVKQAEMSRVPSAVHANI